MQAGNLCVDHEVHEVAMKFIAKKHYTLPSHKNTMKYHGHKKKESSSNKSKFVGGLDFIFPVSRDQNKCKRKIEACS